MHNKLCMGADLDFSWKVYAFLLRQVQAALIPLDEVI